MLRAMMESARGEPINANDLLGSGMLSASPRVGPNRCAITSNCSNQSAVGQCYSSRVGCRWSDGYGVVVRSAFGPDGPRDARELVRERDRGLVVTSTLLSVKRPGSEAIVRAGLLGVAEHRPGAVDEEHPEVDITALADGAETPAQAGGRSPGL